MSKPTYYLWRSSYATEEEFEREKKKYNEVGFRIIILEDGPKEKDIHAGIRAIIKNHYQDS